MAVKTPDGALYSRRHILRLEQQNNPPLAESLGLPVCRKCAKEGITHILDNACFCYATNPGYQWNHHQEMCHDLELGQETIRRAVAQEPAIIPERQAREQMERILRIINDFDLWHFRGKLRRANPADEYETRRLPGKRRTPARRPAQRH